MSYRTLRRLATGLLAVVAVAVCAASAASASTDPAKPDVSAQFTTAGSVAPQFLQNATTIEHWTFQYTDPQNHVTYPITMVGKDPRSGGTSTIHTVIIALNLNFVAGHQDPPLAGGDGLAKAPVSRPRARRRRHPPSEQHPLAAQPSSAPGAAANAAIDYAYQWAAPYRPQIATLSLRGLRVVIRPLAAPTVGEYVPETITMIPGGEDYRRSGGTAVLTSELQHRFCHQLGGNAQCCADVDGIVGWPVRSCLP